MCRGLARAVGGPSGSQNRWLRAFTLATKSPETRRSPAVVVIETPALQWVLRPARQWWTCASGVSIAASATAFNHVRTICAASIPTSLICREETTSGTTTGITSRLGPRPRFVERPIGCSGRSHLGRFDRVSAVCLEWPAPAPRYGSRFRGIRCLFESGNWMPYANGSDEAQGSIQRGKLANLGLLDHRSHGP